MASTGVPGIDDNRRFDTKRTNLLEVNSWIWGALLPIRILMTSAPARAKSSPGWCSDWPPHHGQRPSYHGDEDSLPHLHQNWFVSNKVIIHDNDRVGMCSCPSLYAWLMFKGIIREPCFFRIWSAILWAEMVLGFSYWILLTFCKFLSSDFHFKLQKLQVVVKTEGRNGTTAVAWQHKTAHGYGYKAWNLQSRLTEAISESLIEVFSRWKTLIIQGWKAWRISNFCPYWG